MEWDSHFVTMSPLPGMSPEGDRACAEMMHHEESKISQKIHMHICVVTAAILGGLHHAYHLEREAA